MVRDCRVGSFRNMFPIAIQLLLSSPATQCIDKLPAGPGPWPAWCETAAWAASGTCFSSLSSSCSPPLPHNEAINNQLDPVLGQHVARLARGQLQEHVAHRYPALALLPCNTMYRKTTSWTWSWASMVRDCRMGSFRNMFPIAIQLLLSSSATQFIDKLPAGPGPWPAWCETAAWAASGTCFPSLSSSCSPPLQHNVSINYQLDLVLGQHGARLPRGQLQEHVAHRYPALALLPCNTMYRKTTSWTWSWASMVRDCRMGSFRNMFPIAIQLLLSSRATQ